MRIMKIHFGHRVGKYDPLVLNYPSSFVPGSARCSSALCLFRYLTRFEWSTLIVVVFLVSVLHKHLSCFSEGATGFTTCSKSLRRRGGRVTLTETDHRNGKWLLLLNRSLMIGWRKNSWDPERVSSVFTFVYVCLSVRGLQSTPFDLAT